MQALAVETGATFSCVISLFDIITEILKVVFEISG